jgi:hypothetical protein
MADANQAGRGSTIVGVAISVSAVRHRLNYYLKKAREAALI